MKTIRPNIFPSVDGGISRASTGTYYDGKTYAKAEENLLKYSQELNNSVWNSIQVTVTPDSGTAAPDGTLTAERLLGVGGTPTQTRIHQVYSNTEGGNSTYTFSIFLKSNTGVSQTVRLKNTHSGVLDNFSSNITVTTSWQRFTYTVTNGASAGTGQIVGVVCDISSNAFDILAWGAQLEQRSSATAYTVTNVSPITNYIPALQTAGVNEARFNHDPVTGDTLGLLIEEQRTNLFTHSDDAQTAWATKVRLTVTSNSIAAPDGSISADTLVEDTANGGHYVERAVTQAANTQITLSVFVKKNNRSDIWLNVYANGYADSLRGAFNLDTGVTSTSTGGTATGATATMQNVGNGWFRIVLSGTPSTAVVTDCKPRVSIINGSTVYTGDGTSGVYIWGVQLEAGAFATSYIPTVATTATREADVVVGSGIIASTVTDPNPVYGSGNTYAVGDKVRYVNRVWESIQNSNTNHQPDISPTWWIDLGADNIHAAFDNKLSTATTFPDELIYAVKPGTFDTAAFIDLDAAVVELILNDPVEGVVYSSIGGLSNTTVYNWYEYFFNDPLHRRTQLIFYDIPQYPNAVLTVKIKYPSSTVSVSQIVFGLISNIGKTQYGVSSGIIDYSVKNTDEFGITSFVKRSFSKRINANVFIPNSKLNRVQRYMYSIRAEPSVWIVSDDPTYEEPLVVFGFYRDFSTQISYPTSSLMSIEIEGLS